MTKLHTLAGLLVATALLLPLAMLWQPRTATSGVDAVASAVDANALLASLLVAAAAALLAAAIGGVFAVLFSLSDLPGSSLWATLLVLAFVCPATVWALAQVYCYGTGGLVERFLGGPWRTMHGLNSGHYLATILVLAQIHVPLACLIVGRGAERLAAAGLEAALFQLRGVALLRWFVGSLRAELTAAILLSFALGAGNFAVPHVLQCRLYPIEIYQRMTNYLDPAGAAWAATPLLAATLSAAALVAIVERKTSFARGRSQASVVLRLHHWKWPALALVLGYLLVTTLLPLGALVVECKSLNYFLAATRDAGPEIDNLLRIGLAAAALATLAGLITGLATASRSGLFVDIASLAPIGVPTLVIGLAYASFFSREWPIDLRWVGDTSLLVILGLAFRGWPFASRLIGVGQRRMPPEWHEAALLGGLGPARRGWWIAAPQLASHVAAGAILAFALAAGDVEISQMLCAPGGGTLAMRLFTFLHFGPTHVAASLSLLLLLITALPVWIFFVLARRQFMVA